MMNTPHATTADRRLAPVLGSASCCLCGAATKPLMEVSRVFAYASAWKAAASTKFIFCCKECFTGDSRFEGEWSEQQRCGDSGAKGGRHQQPVGPSWVEWDFDQCLHCGDAAEILTCAEPGCAFDGDEARCMRCGMPGHIRCDSETPASIVWHDEPDCDCEWCKEHPPEGCECWPNAVTQTRRE